MVNGEVVDEVDHFNYLGSKVSTSGDGEEEILVRISMAKGRPLPPFEALGDQPEDKEAILQKQCLKHSTVWGRILEDDQNHQSQA